MLNKNLKDKLLISMFKVLKKKVFTKNIVIIKDNIKSNDKRSLISSQIKNITTKNHKEVEEELKVNINTTGITNTEVDISIEKSGMEQIEEHLHINYSNIKGVRTGDSSHYIIQFTCTKCEHRTTRMFTKTSYHKGVVLIKCEGCEGVHLIADNLGWFEDTSVNVEDIIKRKGEEYRKLNVEGLFQMSTKDAMEDIKNGKI